MTGLLATFLASPAEPIRRGDLDGAAWRFVLPRECEVVDWHWQGRGHERDISTLARYATVRRSTVVSPETVSPETGSPDRAADLVVGSAATPGEPSAAPVAIDFDGGGSGQPLELRYVDDDLRGVVPLDHRRARSVLARHVGHDGPVSRSLKQRLKGAPVRVRRTASGSLRGAPTGPPAWLVDAAAASGHDIVDHEWALWCRGDFGSQKLIMFLVAPGHTEPSIVVKIVRDARFNDRLVNESDLLGALGSLGSAARGGAPSLLFHTTFWGSATSAQSAVIGDDLRGHLQRRPELVDRVTSWMIDMATATATPVEGDELERCLGEVLARYLAAYTVPAATARFLRQQLDLLTDTRLEAVMQHGDPGPWNAVLTERDEVAFLDWEAGERHGLPLWDLLYFLRSASLVVSPRRPWQSRLSRSRRDLVLGSPRTELLADQVRTYVDAIGLDRRLVGPLYHFCWVHRAVKEARRLAPERRSRGSFHRFLLAGIEGRDRPGLRLMTLRSDDEGVDRDRS